jgi:site-specific recombinase XerD
MGGVMATKFKAADGFWYIKYKGLDGKWKSKFCGKAANATDAETIRKLYDSEELNRRHSATVRIVDTDIYEALKNYKENEIPKSRTGRPKSFKGIQRYEAIIDNTEKWFQKKGVQAYSDVTEDIIKSFFDDMVYNLKRSASTISKHRQILINFFDWSISKNYCTINPASVINNPKKEKKIPRFFTHDELNKIFSAAKEPYKNVFKFLYLTGLRIGELGNLEWSDYIEGQNHIVLRVMEGNKTKREEIVPLNKAATAIIEEQKKQVKGKYVFENAHGNKLDNANIYRALEVILKNEKITNASPHTFRHTCASHLVIQGVSLYIVKEILRHASIKETEIYAHLSKEAVSQAIEKLTA